jgi:cardiolipin synthase
MEGIWGVGRVTRRRRSNRRWANWAAESLESRQLLAAVVAEASPQVEVRSLSRPATARTHDRVFVEPEDGRGPLLDAIGSARREIRITICIFSDPTVGKALEAAAARGVSVRMIVDRAAYADNPAERDLLAEMARDGVSWRLSNPVFVQSYEKGFIIDQREALIMSLCPTIQTFYDTRDYGLITRRPALIGEMARVFEADWPRAAPPGVVVTADDPTPALHVHDLLWGPVSARTKLNQLIAQARRSIDATSELLGDPFLESALIAAARRGVRVRLIVPLSVRGSAPAYNEPSIVKLRQAGVDVHVTLGPAPSPANPYMHAKTMVVDDRVAYLGSIDLQSEATVESRELGVLMSQRPLVAQLSGDFAAEWSNSQAPPLPVVSGAQVLSGRVGVPLVSSLTAGNDWSDNQITMSVPAATLPPGLAFSFDAATGRGTVAGTPEASGTFIVPLTVTNTVNQANVDLHILIQ